MSGLTLFIDILSMWILDYSGLRAVVNQINCAAENADFVSTEARFSSICSTLRWETEAGCCAVQNFLLNLSLKNGLKLR